MKVLNNPSLRTFKIMALSGLFGLLFWVIDGFYDFIFFDSKLRFAIFQAPVTLSDSLIFNVAPHDLLARISFMAACLAGGFLMAKLVTALSDSEKKYRTFVDQSPDCIVVLQNGGYKLINAAFTRLFGYTQADVDAGLGYEELVKPEEQDFVRQRVADRLAGKEGLSGILEIELVAKNGRIIPCETAGTLIRYGGEPADLVIMRDISERRKAEAEMARLREHQRQTSKVEAIGNFANGIAHDFNNALTPVIGGCEILLYKMPVDCKHVCEDQIMAILEAANTASHLVHRMQTFTRKENGVIIPLRLATCLKDSFDFLRSMTPSSIEMQMDMAPDLGLVNASDITLRQILMNLCKNSIQAMPGEKGRIDITVTKEKVHVERFGLTKGEYVRIEVTDDGAGMTQDVLERALDPYFTTKEVGTGTGIGLSVVDNIIRSYGGIINLYSEPGAGTKAVVYLPSVEPVEGMEIKECVMEEAVQGGEQHILLVDDEPHVLKTVILILESLNYKVTGFADSRKALAEFQEHPDDYDLVITDLTMPGLTGGNLVIEMRKLRPGLKMILCSGLGSDKEMIADLGGKKVEAYLTKPVTRAEYGTVLARIFANNKLDP